MVNVQSIFVLKVQQQDKNSRFKLFLTSQSDFSESETGYFYQGLCPNNTVSSSIVQPTTHIAKYFRQHIL